MRREMFIPEELRKFTDEYGAVRSIQNFRIVVEVEHLRHDTKRTQKCTLKEWYEFVNKFTQDNGQCAKARKAADGVDEDWKDASELG
jgi:hypothetical protein